MFIIQFIIYIAIFFVLFALVSVAILIFRFWNVIRLVFGGQRNGNTYTNATRRPSADDERTSVRGEQQQSSNRPVKDDGEYVEFEELP